MPNTRLAAPQFKGVLLRSILIPVFLMVVLAALFVWQLGNLIRNTTSAEAIDQTLVRVNELERMHVDLETGLRGYLLTADIKFLEPYERAIGQMPALLARVREELRDDAENRKLFDETSPRREAWLRYAASIRAQHDAGDAGWRTPMVNSVGKDLMDNIRAALRRLRESLDERRRQRSHDVQRSAQLVVTSACVVAVLVGLLISYTTRQDLARVSRSYENALEESQSLRADLERRVEERTAQLTQSNGRLNEANQELEAFAYSVSHDLRAPMRHIAGFSNLLKASTKGQLSADDAETLDTINSTAVLAGRMVDDLLAFSRVGRTQLKLRPVDTEKQVREVIESFEADTSGRPFAWSIGELPDATGDAALLRLVWQNLIGNAIKYTAGRDPAEIAISGEVGADGRTTYRIRDNGVGFDMAYAHKLFGVFQRLHRAEEFEGTGIGLANVRRIILRHGGEIVAEGVVGVGATFTFSLPAPAPEAPTE